MASRCSRTASRKLRNSSYSQRFQSLIGTKDLVFHLLQLRRDESFGIRHGLLARVFRRDLVEMGLGNFNEVTKDRVVFDFQRGNPSAVLLRVLQLGDPLLALACRLAEFIDRIAIPVSKDAAFLERGGEVLRRLPGLTYRPNP